MITLLTYKPALGEAAASPFCVKAIWLLNMSGQDWQREDLADPRQMPHAKIPAIRVGGRSSPTVTTSAVTLRPRARILTRI